MQCLNEFFLRGMALKSLHMAGTLELRDPAESVCCHQWSVLCVHCCCSLLTFSTQEVQWERRTHANSQARVIQIRCRLLPWEVTEILGERLASLTGFFQAQLWFVIFTCCILLCAGTRLSALLNHLSESSLFLLLEIEGCDEKDRRMSEPHKKTYPDLRTQLLLHRFLLSPTFSLVSRQTLQQLLVPHFPLVSISLSSQTLLCGSPSRGKEVVWLTFLARGKSQEHWIHWTGSLPGILASSTWHFVQMSFLLIAVLCGNLNISSS